MIIYAFDKDGVYTMPVAARLSPARPQNSDGTWNYIIPSGTTAIEPPTAGANQAAVFRNGAWSLVDDYRGATVYSTETGEQVTIRSLGGIPDGYTTQNFPGAAYTWDGSAWAVNLSRHKETMCSSVDNAAEALRNTVVSPGSAQAMTYIDKERQALAYLASENPVDSEYPALVAEIGINGDTARDVASTIAAYAAAWRTWNATVENVRLTAKKQIKESLYVVAIDDIMRSISWPEIPNVELQNG